jgi:integrase
MIGAHRNPMGGFDVRRDEKPLRRENPSGKVRFVARFTGEDGRRRSAGTFVKEGPCKQPRGDGECCAQHAIWAAYERGRPREKGSLTVREYVEGPWLVRHPRAERTEKNYRSRVGAVLDARTQDGVFGELPVARVRPKHLDDLVDVMLREHGRALSGVRGVVAVLSSLFMDAIRDEYAEMNPALVVTVRDRDPRVRKAKREPVLCSWDEMHAFAACAGEHEPMVRVLSDCGLRLGELLGLECRHVRGDVLVVEQHAWLGVIVPGTKQGARREVPLPPRLGSLLALARRDRIGVLFPGPSGGAWSETQFYRGVWGPARRRSGLALNPHDLRHSFVSLMRAAGVDPADLAASTGHTVQTATGVYTHATGGTFELMRGAVGE